MKHKFRCSLIPLVFLLCLLGTLIVGCNQTRTSSVLSEVMVYDVLESTATISLHSKDYNTILYPVVEYGISTDYGSSKNIGSIGRITLVGLSPGTTYHFRITAVDNNGQKVSSPDKTFTTLTPKGTFSARLFPVLGGQDPSVLYEEYHYIDRLNTNFFNGSSNLVIITKIQFLYPSGRVAYALPESLSAANDYKGICLTLGRSDLPGIWENWEVPPGDSLFTGIEFNIGLPARELEGWYVLWHGLDNNGDEFTCLGEYSELP